jgi:hypothetical protein
MSQISTGYVFMSYSRRDTAVMRRIASFLRNKGIKVWVDNEKLTPGTPIWEEEIEKAIQNASAVIVVLSPDSKGSEWVRREITLADQNERRVFPVLVGGDEKASISLRLMNRQFVDIRENEDAGLVSLETALLEYFQELSAQEPKKIEDKTPTTPRRSAPKIPTPRKPENSQQSILKWAIIGIIGLCVMATGVWGLTYLISASLPSQPTLAPSTIPSLPPSSISSVAPSQIPSLMPSEKPTLAPSAIPTITPSPTSTITPSAIPTVTLIITPTTPPSRSSTMTTVRLQVVTGNDGTNDKPIFELYGTSGKVFEYVMDTHPNSLQPNQTDEYIFSIPLDICDVTGYTLKKPAGNSGDDAWDIREIYIYINDTSVFFDRAVSSFSPLTSTSYPPNGNWSGTTDYVQKCGQ